MPEEGEEGRPSSGLDRGGAGAGPRGPRQVVSGSFGSFEGSVGRFDERGYRLGQDGGGGSGNGRGLRDGEIGEEGKRVGEW